MGVSIGLGLLWSVASPAQPIRKLDPDLQAVLDTMYVDPGAARKRLEAVERLPGETPSRQVQYLWVQAELENSLSLNRDAGITLQKAWEVLDPQAQPWLHHLVLLTQARIDEASGHPSRALPNADQVVAWATAQQDDALLLDGLVVRGMVQNTLMDYEAALRDFQAAYELVGRAPQISTQQSEIAGFIALVYEYRREPALAIPYFQESVDFYRQKENDMELSIALYGLGKAHKNNGHAELGRQLLQESLERATKVGDEQGIAYALVELAAIMRQQGKTEQALAYYREAQSIFSKADNPYKLYDVFVSQAQVLLKQGMIQAAAELLHQAEVQVKRIESPVLQNNLRFLEAELAARKGDFEAAYQGLKAAAAHRQELNTRNSTERLHQLQARFQLRMREQQNHLLKEQTRIINLQLLAEQRRNTAQNTALVASVGLGSVLLVWALWSRRQKRRMEKLATTDYLTGLPNRRAIMDKARALKAGQAHPVTLALADFDDFKVINDRFGHAVGDEVLRRFGAVCRNWLASIDDRGCVGRVGGEEFLVLLPGVGLEKARKWLESLAAYTEELSNQLPVAGVGTRLSIGLCEMGRDTTLEKDFSQIDQALYDAKAQGKRCIIVAREVNNGE